MMVIIVDIMILSIGVFHNGKPCLILRIGIQRIIVRVGFCKFRTLNRYHAGDIGQILYCVVLFLEHGGKERLAEIARVVPYDVLHNLHALFMHRVD